VVTTTLHRNKLRSRHAGIIEIRPLGEHMKEQALRFIGSWTEDDAYDRFGSAGTGGSERLAKELTQDRRPALIAVNESGVVGLLDHVVASGATYFGVLVEARFRRLGIGAALVQALLQSPLVTHPFVSESDHYNYAAVALMRTCHFSAIESDPYQITWCHE
jgi:GNAT superfamily N-acetyltransferase